MSYGYKTVNITTYLSQSGTVNNLTQTPVNDAATASQRYQGISSNFLKGSNLTIEKMYTNTIGYSLNTNTGNSSLTRYMVPSYTDCTTPATLTPPSWATHCSVICIGAGGGGAGGTQGFQKQPQQSKNSQAGSGGGGGGSGGIVYLYRTPITGQVQVTTGAGGGGGAMDQGGGAGQPSFVVIQGGASITAGGGGGGTTGSSNGGGGGAGGAGGTNSVGTGYISGAAGPTGNNTEDQNYQSSTAIVSNIFNSNSILPKVSVWGQAGQGGGAGNSNSANSNTPGRGGTQGFARVYWLNANL